MKEALKAALVGIEQDVEVEKRKEFYDFRKTMNITQRVLSALLMVLGFCMSGCTPVAPWQRGTLAKPQMALDVYPVQNAFQAHIYDSRESASGSSSAGGGGCGCN